MRIHRLTASHAPVFLINSQLFGMYVVCCCLLRLAQHPYGGSSGVLLIEVTEEFAGFLNHDSLERLGMLS